MTEKYFDANHNLITEGFYRGTNGGMFRVKRGEHGKFIVIDAVDPDTKYGMAQHLAFQLTPIANPQREVATLRDYADWLESQLENLANEKTGGN